MKENFEMQCQPCIPVNIDNKTHLDHDDDMLQSDTRWRHVRVFAKSSFPRPTSTAWRWCCLRYSMNSCYAVTKGSEKFYNAHIHCTEEQLKTFQTATKCRQ